MSSEDPTQVFPKALEEIRRRLHELEEKVAKRGYDTRPIFEAHEVQIADLKNRIDEFEQKAASGAIGDLDYVGWAYFAGGATDPFVVTVTNQLRERWGTSRWSRF